MLYGRRLDQALEGRVRRVVDDHPEAAGRREGGDRVRAPAPGGAEVAPGALGRVEAPTLLVVGGDDELVLERNRWAASQLRCPHRVDVLAGAGHLFEEEGALERVAALAADWFVRHLPRS